MEAELDNFKALKLLCNIEKLLIIRRDFGHLKFKTRFFVYLALFIDFSISVLVHAELVLESMRSEKIDFVSVLVSFQFLFIFQSLLIASYYGPRCSTEFKQLTKSLSCAHQIIQNDRSYQKALSHLKTSCVLIISSFTVVRSLLTVYDLTQIINRPQGANSSFIVIHLFLVYSSRFWADSRYVMGIMLYCVVVLTVKNMLDSLSAAIKTAATSDCFGHRFNSYVTAYRHLTDSSRHLKNCFGHTILITLALTTTYFIFIVYRAIWVILHNYASFPHTLAINQPVLYVMWVVMYCLSGQQLHNAVSQLHQTLAKICFEYSTDSQTANKKEVKDFLRLVAVKPVETCVLHRGVGMHLLPAVLMLTVNYIIVLLQLNHDV